MSKIYLIVFCLFLTGCVSPAFRSIQGKNTDAVRAIKGNPVTILKENEHEMWTYRQNECTQIIFFNDQGKATDWHEMGICQIEE